MAVPNIFATATSSIPLSQLDTNFATAITLGSTALYLGNTTTSVAGLTLTGATLGGTFSGTSVTDSGLTSGRVTYAGTAGLLQDSANLTFNGTTLTAAGFSGPISGVITSSSITDSGLTSGRVTYAGTAGLLQDSANLTFNGTTLTANTIGAFTLSGTVAGGGNQLNNVIIGTTTPLAGNFTTVTASGVITCTRTSSLCFLSNGATTSESYGAIVNGSGGLYFGVESSVGGIILGGTSAYAGVVGTFNNKPVEIVSNNAKVASFSSTGLAVAGTLSATGIVKSSLAASDTAGGGGLWLEPTGSSYVQSIRATTAGGIAFDLYSGGWSNKMTLDSSGNLGLGVTPSAWASGWKALQFSSTGGNPIFLASSGDVALGLLNNAYYNGSNYIYQTGAPATQYYNSSGAHYWLKAPSGTAGASAAVTSGQSYTVSVLGSSTLAQWQAFFSALTILPTVGQVITATATGSIVGGGTVTQNITFTTAMTLDASGTLLVGTTGSPWLESGTTAASATIKAGGFGFAANAPSTVVGIFNRTNTTGDILEFKYNAAVVGQISTNGTVVTYGGTSDYRLKTVSGAVTGQGERIDALEPIEYTWNLNGSRTRGFLAHKFQEVYADSVTGTKDAIDADGNPMYQSMQAGSAEVIADLVAEIQSLRKRITALEAK